jgi:hypothetical protein
MARTSTATSKIIGAKTNPKKNVMYPGKPSTPGRMVSQYGTGSVKDNKTYDKRTGGSGASSVGRIKMTGIYKSPVSKGKGDPKTDTASKSMGKQKFTSQKLSQD